MEMNEKISTKIILNLLKMLVMSGLLGLVTDGFSPFNNFGQAYFVWPMIMVLYNLPPLMCMKDPYLFMTLLIPGSKSPIKDINVYLRPLVDELLMLWEMSVETYDKFDKQNFIMKAALMWTINDFPALRMISGWSTHGKLSCPVYMGDVLGAQLKHSGKTIFFGTARSFLQIQHKYRRMSASFNRKFEKRGVDGRMSGREVLNWVKELKFPLPGKEYSTVRAEGYGKIHNFTHLCMFFELLPYWVKHMLRHCIDAMHTENNFLTSFTLVWMSPTKQRTTTSQG